MKLLIGNFKGPQGEPGNVGQTGAPGPKGEPGDRGSRWTSGTAITGTNTEETIFADSGITDAAVDDYYLNTTTGNLYQCTASGAADTAKWVYIGNFKGPKGNDGPAGSISDINDQIPTYTEATQLENIESGETVKIAFGKLKKALSVFIVHHTQKATAAILGHVKLSNSAAITKAGEYALDAIEKNATIEGTLAHIIDSRNNDLTNSINQLNSNMMNKGIFIDAWISKNIKIGEADDADYPASVNNQLPFDNYHKTGECFTLLPDGGIQCNRAGTVITFLQIVDTPDTVGMNLIYKLSSKNAPYSHEKRFGFRPVAQMLRNMTALNVYTVQNGTIITCEAINYTSSSNVIINGINPYNTRISCILC